MEKMRSTMLGNRSSVMAQRLQETFAAVEISPRGNVHPKKAMMEDLVKIATLYYNKSSRDVKIKAHDFFNSLDSNNDGKVSLHEFLGCMRELGHVKMGSRHFFEELDQDKNGTLDFMEVMALYYMIKSGRPFCCGCDEFIPGMYFTCAVCFENGSNSFRVCPNCFQDGTFNHGHHQFLDNYALLEAKRIQGTATYSNQYKPNSSVTNAVIPYQKPPSVPSQRSKITLKGFEIALNSAFNAVAGAAGALAAPLCTIM